MRTPGAYQVPEGLNLLDACLQGKAALSNYSDFVKAWYPEPVMSPHHALGLTDYGFYLFLQHSDCVLEEALTCKRLGAHFDSMWTPERVPALLELCREIKAVKVELHDQRYMTNAAAFEKLAALGELFTRKNELTGMAEDLQYLYVDNGEYLYHVAGFPGDETPLVDANGLRLLVGDTVSYPDGRERMVILGGGGTPMLHQEELLKGAAVKKSTCWELDMDAARCAAFTVTRGSCLERYQRLHPAEAPETGGMKMTQG